MKYLIFIFSFFFFLNTHAQEKFKDFNISGTKEKIYITVKKSGGLKKVIIYLDSISKTNPNHFDSLKYISLLIIAVNSDLEKELSQSERVKYNLKESGYESIDHKILSEIASKTIIISDLLNLFPSKSIENFYIEKCYNRSKDELIDLRCSQVLIFLKN